MALKHAARGRLNHASVDDGPACRIERLFNINHGLTDNYLEHLDFKLRASMLLQRSLERFMQSVIASRAAVRGSTRLIGDNDKGVREAGRWRDVVSNCGTGTTA
ncbi:hypothetical protein ACFQX9_30300 [Bradyrhizobium sp. GCM10028915]|uniref:hypothetical protein n=1 Tax=Bradyrhizobium sp. GCM10028915 TaxID=3273385 RepID=UPI00360B35C8